MVRSRKLTLTNWTAANNALNQRFGDNKSALAKHVKMSRTTVTNFFNEKPVGQVSFEKICRALRLNWQDVSSVSSTVDTSNNRPADSTQLNEVSIEQVRERCRQKILERHSRMRLLSGEEVGVDQLYVDVWLLKRPERKRFDSPEKLLSSFDIAKDRLALSKRIRRNPGFKIANSDSRIVILGKPGSGKTTFLKHLAIDWFKGKFQSDKIAVLIELRRIQNSQWDIWRLAGQDLGLDDWQQFASIKREIENIRKNPIVGKNDDVAKIKDLENQLISFQLHHLLKQGKLLLLIDGLDEVPTDELRRNIQAQVKQISEEYSKDNRIILSCRTQIMEVIPSGFTSVEVADFNEAQVRSFVQNWFIANGQSEIEANEQWQQIAQATNAQPDLRELAATPVLLSLMCLVLEDQGEIPTNRSWLYSKGIKLLLSRWNNEKAIEDWEVGTEAYRQLNIEDKEALLIEIAARKFENPKNFVLFEQDELVRQIIHKLQLANTHEGTSVLKAIEAQHGLLIERADQLWSFSHLTFQEYFTVQWLTQLTPQQLAEKIANQQWQKTVGQLVKSQRECIDFCVSAFFLHGKAFWEQDSKMRQGCPPIFNGSVPFFRNIVHG